jgi:hypothetical protein
MEEGHPMCFGLSLPNSAQDGFLCAHRALFALQPKHKE